MQDGFLGYRTSFMLDFVVVALVAVVPLLILSLWTVKARRNYRGHRNLQLLLATVLLAAVVAFEIDLHWIQGGWQKIVAKRVPALSDADMATVRLALRIHLVFAITTPLLWIATIALALRKFRQPPVPGPHSPTHKVLGWLSALDLTLTSVTGLIFYYLAFVRGI